MLQQDFFPISCSQQKPILQEVNEYHSDKVLETTHTKAPCIVLLHKSYKLHISKYFFLLRTCIFSNIPSMHSPTQTYSIATKRSEKRAENNRIFIPVIHIHSSHPSSPHSSCPARHASPYLTFK